MYSLLLALIYLAFISLGLPDALLARYDERLFKTYKNQLVMYAIMIEETFGRKVNKGFLVYCREGNRLVEVCVTEEDKDKLCRCIEEYKMVLDGYYPEATKQKSKCLDCCYKNICIKI